MAIKLAPDVGQKGVLASLPVLGAAFLPKIVCAACWPAYTAALGTLGIEFFNYTPYVAPLTLGALVIAIASLAFLARLRRRIEPLALGVVAAAAVVFGTFALESKWLLYAGIGMLMVTSLFPWRSKVPTCCT